MIGSRVCVALSALLAATSAIPVDNGVQGDPEIMCGPTGIMVTFNTENNFEGHVYVKNMFADDACRVTSNGANPQASIELQHDACDVARTRSADPKGIFMTTTIVISFHPRFLTKVDRAYTIQCFYMEADKTVSTDIEVSMITTGFQTQFVPMPVCRYEILDAAEGGNPVQFAIIGQPVYHKWTCDTDTSDTFCMKVHSCYVDDGAGDRLDLVDVDGCAFDQYLIGNLEYPSDLMAVKEVHVFKYADRPALRFQCQITIDVKPPNGDCSGTQPECTNPNGGGDGDGLPVFNRNKRSSVDSVSTIDVMREIEAIDISPELGTARVPSAPMMPHVTVETAAFCLSPMSALGLFGVTAVVLVAVVVVAARQTMKH